MLYVRITQHTGKEDQDLRGVIVLLFLPYTKGLPGTFFQSWGEKKEEKVKLETPKAWLKGSVCGGLKGRWGQLSCIYHPGDKRWRFYVLLSDWLHHCEGKHRLSELKTCSWSSQMDRQPCDPQGIFLERKILQPYENQCAKNLTRIV